MSEQPIHRRYVMIFAVACLAILLPVLVLNYLLGLRSLGGVAVVLEASRWQQETRGVTYAPPLSANRPFKSARLFDRLPEINAVVFGSSTAMSITQEMFPPGVSIYNFSQTGNVLATVVGEVEFLLQSQPALKWFVVPFDWALGSPYWPGESRPQDLAPPQPDSPGEDAVPISQRLSDALSLPRVKNLAAILGGVARASSPYQAFGEMFMQNAGEPYRCSDGTPARDFDTIFRSTCTGFRYDGSATFANHEPLSPQRTQVLIASAVVPSSKYATALIKSGGEPNQRLLEQLAVGARVMRERGGALVLLLPPLLPGLDRALHEAPDTSAALARTRQVLAQWAVAARVVVIDAGASERFGCAANEFVDEHHALPACYARVFSRLHDYWSHPAAFAPGLWPGKQ